MHTAFGMSVFVSDLRHGLRVLGRNPGFTAVALLTLTLGIGATSAIFSVVDAVLMRPLPHREPDRIMMVFEDLSEVGFPRNTPAPGNYAEWKAQTAIFEDLAATTGRVYNLSASGGDPEKLEGAAVTLNLFTVFGVKPVVGRLFTPEEDLPGAPRVVLIGHGLWKRRFGAAPNVAGRQILLNNEKYTVAGVMPQGFSFPAREVEIWTPIAFTPADLTTRGSHYLKVVGRLRPGVSPAEANAALDVLCRRMARDYPDTNAGITRFFAEPLQESYVHDVRRGLLVLMTAVGFILLIACANISNLWLSRAAVRQREIALRTSLGATRGRIVRQLLAESVLLAAGGGTLGILVADWCFEFLKNLIPEDLVGTVSLALDWRVLGFTLTVSVASSVLFGLAPALQVSLVDLNGMLKEGSRGTAGSSRTTLRNLLVVAEVALSLMLLTGSGLLLESFANLRRLNPGFRSDHVLTARVDVPESKYRDFAKRAAFFQQVLDSVRALPGVKAAGFTSALPLTWKGGTSSFTPEKMVLRPELTYDANNRVITPGYFETMRIPLKRGRLFDARDGQNAPPVAIINETMARTFWAGQDPIGKRFKMDSREDDTPWVTIVGIVGDVRQMNLDEPPRQEMYFPHWQAKGNWMVPRDLVVLAGGDPFGLASAVRRSISSIDADQPVSALMTLDALLDNEVAQRRVQATLLGGFAALALVLACIGLYGVLSYLVAQRTQEIGVRLALGATSSDVFRAIARQGLKLAALGVVIGVAASLALSRVLTNLLFGVNATNLPTYLRATAVFAVVALLACAVPALRASRVDPIVALRYE